MSTNKSAKAFVINFEGDTELLDRALKNAEKEAQKLGGTLTNSFIKSSADGKKFTAQVELLLSKFKDLEAVRARFASGKGFNFSDLGTGKNLNVSLDSLKLKPLTDVAKDTESLKAGYSQRLAVIRNAVDTEIKIYRNGADSIKAIRKEEKDTIAKLDASYAKKAEEIANRPSAIGYRQRSLTQLETKYQKDLEAIRKQFSDRELAAINADKALKAKEERLRNSLRLQESLLSASLKRQTALLQYGGNSQQYFEARKTSNLGRLSAQKDYLISQVDARNLPSSQRLAEIAKINAEYERQSKKVIEQYVLATDTLKKQAEQEKAAALAHKQATEAKIAAEKKFQENLTTTEKQRLAAGRVAVARAGVAASPDSVSKVNALREAELAQARTLAKLKLDAIKADETSTTRQGDMAVVMRALTRIQQVINTNRDADIAKIQAAQEAQREYNRTITETSKRLAEASKNRIKLSTPPPSTGNILQTAEELKSQKLLAQNVKAQEQLNALKDAYNQKAITGAQYLAEQDKVYSRLERNHARLNTYFDKRLQLLTEVHSAEKRVETSIRIQTDEQLRLNALKEKTLWGRLTAPPPITKAPDPFLKLSDPKAYIAQANAYADYVKKANTNLETFGNTYTQWMGKVVTSIGLYQILYNSLNKISEGIRNIPDSGIRLEASQATLTATLKSYSAMQQEMQVFRKEAERTGIPITTIRKGFDQLAPSAMMAGESVATVNEILKNMNTVTTTLHKSEDDVQGIYLAFSQMFSKNKVQAEELVKQLSQRIPGAVPAMAKAFGRITGETEDLTNKLQKAMKKGLVEPHKLLLEFTKVLEEAYGGDAFARATEGLNANIGRLKTQYEELSNSVYLATSKMMIDTLKSLTGGIAGLNEYAKNTEQLRLDILNLIETIKTLAITAIGGLFLSKTFAMVGAFTSLRASITLTQAKFNSFNTAIIGNSNAWQNIRRNALGAISAITSNLAVMATAAVVGFSLIDDELAKIENRRKSIQEGQEETRRLLAGMSAKESGNPALQAEMDSRVRAQRFVVEQAQKDLEKYQESLNSLRDPLGTGVYLPQVDTVVSAIFGKDFQEQLAQKKETLRSNLKDYADIYKKVTEEIKGNNELLKEGIDKIIPEETFEKVKDYYNFLREISETNLNIDRTVSDRRVAEIDSQIKQLQMQMNLEQDNLNQKKILTERIGNLEIEKQREALKLSEEQLKVRQEGLKVIQSQTNKDEIDIPRFIAAVQQHESRGNPRAISPALAMGLRQVMPENMTGRWGGINLNVPEEFLYYSKKENRSKITPAIKKRAADWAEQHTDGIRQISNLMLTTFLEQTGNMVDALILYNSTPAELKRYHKTGQLNEETRNYIPAVMKIYDSKASTPTDLLRTNEQIATSETDLIQKKLALQDAEMQKAANLQQINEQIRKAKEEQLATQQQQVALLQEEIEGLTGGKSSRQAAQVEIEYLKKRKEYLADTTGGKQRPENTEALKLLETWKGLKLETAKVSDIQADFAQAQETYNTKEQSITQQKQLGFLTEVTAMKQLLDLRKAYTAEAENYLNQLDAIANKTQNIELANKVSKERTSLQGLNAPTTFTQEFLKSKTPEYQSYTDTLSKIDADRANNLSVLEADSTKTLAEKQAQQLRLEDEHLKAKFMLQSTYYGSLAGTAASTFEGMTEAAVKAYGAQSKAARTAFAAYKAMKVSEIIMNTASAIVAQLTIPYVGIPMAAMVAAMGAVQLAQVVAQPMPQAHGGLDYVPENATYKLTKGERVLAPNQNRALMKALEQGNTGNAPQPSGNVKIINVSYGEDYKKFLTSLEGERIIVNHMTTNLGV